MDIALLAAKLVACLVGTAVGLYLAYQAAGLLRKEIGLGTNTTVAVRLGKLRITSSATGTVCATTGFAFFVASLLFFPRGFEKTDNSFMLSQLPVGTTVVIPTSDGQLAFPLAPEQIVRAMEGGHVLYEFTTPGVSPDSPAHGTTVPIPSTGKPFEIIVSPSPRAQTRYTLVNVEDGDATTAKFVITHTLHVDATGRH